MQVNDTISVRRLDWLLRLLLVGAVLAVFWPVLQTRFMFWDDDGNILIEQAPLEQPQIMDDLRPEVKL